IAALQYGVGVEVRECATEVRETCLMHRQGALGRRTHAMQQLADAGTVGVDVRERTTAAFGQRADLPVSSFEVARRGVQQAAVQLRDEALLRLESLARMHQPPAQMVDMLHARLEMAMRAAAECLRQP